MTALDELTLIVEPPEGGAKQAFTGWTSTRVTRGIDRLPSDFEIEATERDPLHPEILRIQPFSPCEILLGSDKVLTGYIDRVVPSLSASGHSIHVVGRSKCEDLVDCAAMFQTFELRDTDPQNLATMLCAPFNISVDVVGDIGATSIPIFAVILSETVADIVARVARYAAILAYDGTDGNLILSRGGSTSMESGFAQGQNIQGATGAFSGDQRYSEVRAVYLSVEMLYSPPSLPTQASVLQHDTLTTAYDKGVPRYRPFLFVAEQSDYHYTVAKARTQWEVNRRWGRSQQVRLVCDSWRDSAGKLWDINALAHVDIPALKINKQVWLISEVSFVKDGRGTRSEVTLMPKEAFSVEPIILNPFAATIAEALNTPAGPNGVGGVLPSPTNVPTGGAQK